MDKETVFETAQVCCIKQCKYPESSRVTLSNCARSSENAWVLVVVHEAYQYKEENEIKGFLFREVQADGVVSDLLISGFVCGDLAPLADVELQRGDTLCLYQPAVYKWKASSTLLQFSDYRVAILPGQPSRVLKLSLTARERCPSCRSPSPKAGNRDGAGGRFPAKRFRPSEPCVPDASPEIGIRTRSRNTDGQPGQLRRRESGGGGPADSTASSDSLAVLPAVRPSVRQSEVSVADSTQPRQSPESSARAPPARRAAGSAEPAACQAPPDNSPAVVTDFLSRVPGCEPHDTYKLLGDISEDDVRMRRRLNVMGVIVDVPQRPRLTARSYMVMAVIKDPSCRVEHAPRVDFVVFGFPRTEAELPNITPDYGIRVGNVLRARHIKVESHQGKLDGRVFLGAALAVFSSAVGDPLTPLGAGDPAPELPAAERARLCWLREWWAVEKAHQERIARAADALLCQVLRPGLYNLRCQTLGLREISGAVFVCVRDGTQCAMPCAEPRPDLGADEVDDPDESETQVFRDQPNIVFVRVADQRCQSALRAHQDTDAQYVQLLRVRVTDELRLEETVSSGLAFALLPEDEPLALQLGSGSKDVLAIQARLNDAAGQSAAQCGGRTPPSDDRDRPAEDRERSAPSGHQPAIEAGPADRPDGHASCPDQPSAEQRAVDPRSSTARPMGTEAAAEPTREGSEALTDDARVRRRADGEGEEANRPGQSVPDGAGESSAMVPLSTGQDPASREAYSDRLVVTTSQESSGTPFPVLNECLDLTETQSQEDAGGSPCRAVVEPSQVSPVSEVFASAPQSPVRAASPSSPAVRPPAAAPAVVAEAALPLVAFSALADQPAGRAVRTRCQLRGGPMPTAGDVVQLLAATCRQSACLTQCQGGALPRIQLSADLTLVHLCPCCGAEMALSLMLPLQLRGVGGAADAAPPLQALAGGEEAERLLGTAVQLTKLSEVRRKLAAVTAALEAGVVGEVGLLPLPESDRRYMVVNTRLTGFAG